ncbi:MAG: Biotin carboxyl carrier protein of acetyl-CoA carboxylase [Chlamydiae bacterium]|nr:Biotin carboxyl carrier protein of acetyl-CoA carboxylase [Chlamydiota bacterium]
MELDLDQIKEILDAFEERNMQKFEIKKGDFKITLERNSNASQDLVSTQTYLPHMGQVQLPGIQAQAPHDNPIIETNAPQEDVSSSVCVTSPMVGTFYSAPAPGESPFVKVGDSIKDGQVVCIVEAMKVMNEVKSTESGVVKEILIEDGHPVEFGSKIFRLG